MPEHLNLPFCEVIFLRMFGEILRDVSSDNMIAIMYRVVNTMMRAVGYSWRMARIASTPPMTDHRRPEQI
jgi:hypothetical protein